MNPFTCIFLEALIEPSEKKKKKGSLSDKDMQTSSQK